MTRCLILVFGWLSVVGLSSLYAQPYEGTVQDTVHFAPEDVVIENREGRITVSTWNRDAAAYKARIVSGQSAETVEQTSVKVDTLQQRLSIESSFADLEPSWSFGPEVYGYGVSHPEVQHTLHVPSSASVRIEDQASTIEVTGLHETLEVETEEGSVDISNNEGTVRIESKEGSVSIDDVVGDLEVDTEEGLLSVDGLRGRLLLDVEEGRAEVAIDSLDTVNIDSDEGVVTLSLPPAAGFALSTSLGADAVLEGDLDFDSLRKGESNYQGTVNGGGPLVRIASNEGKIRLRRP